MMKVRVHLLACHLARTMALCIGLLLCSGVNAAAVSAAAVSDLQTDVSAQALAYTPTLEARAETLLEAMAEGEFDEAAAQARQLIDDYPRFRLGQWLHAELSAMLAMDPLHSGDTSDWSETAVGLLLEARTRLKTADFRTTLETQANAEKLLPSSLVHLGLEISDAIVVDLSRSELMHFVVEEGQPELVERHYISSGSAGFGKRVEGDRRTPLGVYRIQGYRTDRSLPDLYGVGALTLDYPNALDRSLGRTGSGIWLHGVPQATHNRDPWSSEGCVTMANGHMNELMERVDRAHTIVVLTDDADWIDVEAQQQLRQELRSSATTSFADTGNRFIGQADGSVTLAALSRQAINNGTLLVVPDDATVEHLAIWPADTPSGADAWRFAPMPAARQGLNPLANLDIESLVDSPL